MNPLRSDHIPKPIAVLVVLWCLAASPLPARDYFVDNVRGDDLSSGRTAEPGAPEGPTRTIAKALRVAAAGDRIVLANTGQPYEESITLAGSRHSGMFDRPFIIEGNGATLTGAAPVPAHLWKHFRGEVFRFPLKELEHQQLFLAGKPARRFVPAGPNWSPADLAPLEWTLEGGYLYFRVEPDKLPDAYEPSYARRQTGITLYKVRNVVLVDLIVQGFHIDGVQVHDARGPCLLAGLTCRGNGRSGIAVVGVSEAAIDACLVGDNGQSQLHIEGPADARVTNSDLLDAVAPKWRIENGKLFVDGKRVEP